MMKVVSSCCRRSSDVRLLSLTMSRCFFFFFVLLFVAVEGGYEEKRPYYFPIYKQPQRHYYHAGFTHGHDGVSATYRNDERQQYVNSVAYTHGTGIGTAPWYGVPGTAYDFTKSSGYGGHEGGYDNYGY